MLNKKKYVLNLSGDTVLVIEEEKKFVEDKDLNYLLSVVLFFSLADPYNEVMTFIKKIANLQMISDFQKSNFQKKLNKQNFQ